MFWSIIGLIVVIAVFIAFLKRLGSSIPILELLLLISGLQWIVGAFIAYRIDFTHFKYYMYVDELTYMSYVVPGYGLFSVILIFFSKKKTIYLSSFENIKEYYSLAIKLLILGVLVDFIGEAPEQIRFFLYFVGSLKYVGAIALYFSPFKWHRFFLFIVFGILVLDALISGMFHELILWSMFFYMFWAIRNGPSIKFHLFIILSALVLGTTIQAIKSEYRALVWNGFTGSKVGLFIDIVTIKLSTGIVDDAEKQQNLNVRLNQGWIISAVMHNVPSRVGYANGATIFESLEAAALPRFLNPNKLKAGGIKNFEKYTGLPLAKGTSMGISIIGEAYVNFGVLGGIIFMGCWAFFLGLLWIVLIDKVNANNKWLFVLPLVFIQVVKAETEFSVVLNHLVKSLVFIFILFYLLSVLKNRTNHNESKS